VADFPFVSYILAFERKVIEDALSEDTNISGHDYLEKIVQVEFDIPAVEETRIQRILAHWELAWFPHIWGCKMARKME
jgi:predicted KAP-like P-loop ATPase